jgi:hypothetical protein
MQDQVVICQKCHNNRTVDLKTPCDSCGASRTIFGYLYKHEFRFAWKAMVTILIAIFLAFLLGLAFLVYQWYLMANPSGSFDGSDLAFIKLFQRVLFGGRI